MAAGSRDPLTNSFAEFLREKRSLAAVVRDTGRVSVTDAVDLVLDVCDELANAHANGIVHGDLGLHRVRTMWPRVPGDSVDIFALDADDTGAIDFRAAFQTPAQAPEQRAGRVGDLRSDIWAVGAILHALVGGCPPCKRPVRELLTGAPHALIACVEQCLAENPAARPPSIDDVAAALASFASSPPERFQQLARRRIAAIKAKHVSEKVATLGKLDEAAVKRASVDRIFAVSSLSGVRAMPVAPPEAINEIPPPPPPTTQHSYDDISVSVEWPQIHGAPSTSIAVEEPPTAAARRETLPPIAPAPVPRARQNTQRLVHEQAWAPARSPAAAAFEEPVRLRRTTTPMFHPWLQHPSMAPPAPPPIHEAPMRSASSFRAAPVTGSASMFPAAAPIYPGTATNVPAVYPGTVTNLPAARPFPGVDPQTPRYRMPSRPSYHPASISPVSLADLNGPHTPSAGRVPSFADLAEYRQAKRESRRAATVAVVVAAAVLILGFGYGNRMLESDRAAMHAAETHVSAVQPPPVAATALPAPVAKNAPAPTTSLSSTPVSTLPATKTRHRHGSHAAAPAPTASQDDRPVTAPTNALSDALGKKEAAPANALDAALK